MLRINVVLQAVVANNQVLIMNLKLRDYIVLIIKIYAHGTRGYFSFGSGWTNSRIIPLEA